MKIVAKRMKISNELKRLFNGFDKAAFKTYSTCKKEILQTKL